MKIALDKHILVWVGGAALGVSALTVACGDRADVHYETARKYEQDYNYPQAIRYYDLVALGFKRSPLAAEARAAADRCRAEVHLDVAERLTYDGAGYTALAEIAAARRLYPHNPRLLYAAGLVHLNIGPPEVALSEFDECIRRYPESPYGYLGRGEYYRLRQERETAFAEYVRAFRAAEADVKTRAAAYRGMRDMAIKLGADDSSLRPFLREGKAAVPTGVFNYWVGYYYLHKPPVVIETALTFFRLSLAAGAGDSYRARDYAGIAECFNFFRKYDKARVFIDKALTADPENDEYLNVAAVTYGKLGLPPPPKTRPQK